MKENMFLWFVLMTVVSWGCYVPTVHEGQAILGDGKPRNGGYQAFVCISGAYLVIGLFVLAAMFFGKLEAISSNPVGFAYAFFGGALGAIGALGITMALKNGGTPLTVPPLVFAGAPIVNVIVSMIWHPPGEAPKIEFWIGLVLASIGTGLVLYGKPGNKPAAKPPAGNTAPATATGSSGGGH